MCYDRMNQLPWGQARWEDTCTQARIIPPTPATAVKGPWSSYMVSSPAGLYSTDARLGSGTVFGFDGTGGASVPGISFAPRIESDQGLEAANWGRVRSNRILHSADLMSGIGYLDGLYVDEQRRGQNLTVWETMMPTKPSRLLEVSLKRTAFHPHTAREVFIGHPFVCDRPEVSLTVAQTGPQDFDIEAHNSTDQVIRTTIGVNLDSGVAGKTQRVELAAGSSKMVFVEPK